MIRFHINLPGSWSKSRDLAWFSSYRHKNLSDNKSFEWQTGYFGWSNLFDFELDLIPFGRDHASVGFSLTILGFMVDCKVYDHRHWDYDTNSWEKYDEEANYYRMAKSDRERADQLELARQLLKDDARQQEIRSVEEFLSGPQGQQLIERKVKEKLEEQRISKEAKRARGEDYRRANLAKKQD